MITRKASAEWRGSLKEGNGSVALGSGAWSGQYSFTSRFADGVGTNPEELIGAAHAGCFSMAFSGGLGRAGFTPERIATSAAVTVEKVGEGFKVTRIHLVCEAAIPGIDEATFQDLAGKAKAGCPISQALAAVPEITLDAKLV